MYRIVKYLKGIQECDNCYFLKYFSFENELK
jgi:hypothetical protein